MPIFFNTLLQQSGILPPTVILVRHQDRSAIRGRTPYELWRDDRVSFELYQSIQSQENRAKFSRASYWASFVGTPRGATMFVGLYAATYMGVLMEDTLKPHKEGVDMAGKMDRYDLRLHELLSDLSGKVFIEWGDGARAWVQRAEKQNKCIQEVRLEFKEPDFPGFLNFIQPLSKLSALPTAWGIHLKQAKGVYLLTCPRTREQYVGSAAGENGFWQRWQDYATTGHGGNVVLRSREPSDYQVAILEVAGSGSTVEDVLAMEQRWKKKLQSREMGLNKN